MNFMTFNTFSSFEKIIQYLSASNMRHQTRGQH